MLGAGDDGLIHGQARDGGVGVGAALLGDDAGTAPQVVHNGVVRLGHHQNVPVPEALGDVRQPLAHAQPGGNRLLGDAVAGEQHMAHHVDLHHVGGAGDAQGHAGGDDHQVAAFHQAGLLGGVHGPLKEGVGVAHLVHQGGHHAPGKVQLAPHVLLGGAAHNGVQGPELGELPGRHAGLGHGDDGLGPQVVGGGAGGVGDGVGHVEGHVAVVPGIKALDVVDALLGLFGNAHHGFQGLHGVFARGGLAGEHDAAGAVVDGVGHVGGLGAGGPGVLHHGVQHLGGGDHLLARQVGFLNQLLLQHRHVLQGDFHAHVAPGHHDAVHHPQDFVDVLHALHVLNLGDDVHGVALVLLQDVADFQDVLGGAGEGGGDVVKAVLNAEDDVRAVLLADKGHGELGARHVDALVVGDAAAV